MAFHGLDYYGIDELYTDEERLIRNTVRDFVSDRVMPSIGKHWSAGTFPNELVPVFGEEGIEGLQGMLAGIPQFGDEVMVGYADRPLRSTGFTFSETDDV